ncbi:MAG: tRNA (adenosine(37)-N6)-threonylcarbamoyltransferase complex ATPase subunit type 1 TsaE, partial [Clostridiales bacterium]|nr:tRNA (adenosine(37)-N6)-threonylcarbamoyltransferase complex ATPase subunit type 1 TsaE [Clostridiales bacterium]
GLGYKEEVTIPTFSICHVYETTPIVYHYDLYRMTNLDDIFSTGLFDSCDENSVLFIEWARNTEELGEEVKTLFFSYGEKNNERIIEAEDGIF